MASLTNWRRFSSLFVMNFRVRIVQLFSAMAPG
jgi:hypothetical protein